MVYVDLAFAGFEAVDHRLYHTGQICKFLLAHTGILAQLAQLSADQNAGFFIVAVCGFHGAPFTELDPDRERIFKPVKVSLPRLSLSSTTGRRDELSTRTTTHAPAKNAALPKFRRQGSGRQAVRSGHL